MYTQMMSPRTLLLIGLAFAIGLLGSSLIGPDRAQAQQRPVEAPPLVDGAPVLDTGRLLVKFAPGVPGNAQTALHRQLGGRVLGSTPTDIQLVTLPDQASTRALAAAYGRSPLVVFAEPDALLPLADTPLVPDDTYYSFQWQHPATDSPAAWGATTGASSLLTTVCDTGVSPNHDDLVANLRWDLRMNTVDGSEDASPVHPHGTFVAGMVAAAGNNGIGVAGVAHTAGIVPVRISNSSGGGAYVSDMVDCILYGAGLSFAGKQLPAPSVSINLSYQTYSNGQIYQSILDAANTAASRGSVVVIAAGNESTNPVTSGNTDPANILYVSSIDEGGGRSSFSNYGPYVDLAAPGGSVVSTYVEVSCSFFFGCSVSEDDLYATWSGTSFAAPMVAGAAVLVQSQNASALAALTPEERSAAIRAALTGGTCDGGSAGEDDLYGSGVLNSHHAVHIEPCGAPAILESLAVTPETASNEEGDSQQFIATATYSDNSTADVTGDVAWSISDTSVATIDASGLATGVSEGGPVTVTASLDTVVGTAILTVTAPVPNSLPTADPGGPYASAEGSTVTFDGSNSFDSDGSIARYEWDFDGDGNFDAAGSSLTSPQHSYPNDGVYAVVLRVTDDDGGTATASTTASVANVVPTAAAGGPYQGVPGSPITFSGGASDPGDDVLTFEWDFHYDGTFAVEASGVDLTGPQHTYATAGAYTIALRVRDDDSVSAVATAAVTVEEAAAVTSIHLGNLADAGSSNNGRVWTAQVEVTVHFNDHTPAASVTVSGSWSDGASGAGSCVTDGSGRCTVSYAGIRKNIGNVSFTVSDLIGSEPYAPGDSDVSTTISVAKP